MSKSNAFSEFVKTDKMSTSDRYFFRKNAGITKMKANTKDDSNGQKKDSVKVMTIKKTEKSGDSRISVAKNISTSRAIIENETSAPLTSTVDKNLSSVFTDNEIILTYIGSTSTSETSGKDFAVVARTPKNLDSQMSVPGVQSVEEKTTSLCDSISESAVDAQSTSENLFTFTSKEFLTNKKSSISMRQAKLNNLDSNAITSPLSETGITEKTTTLNNSFNNQRSSTVVKPSIMKTSTIVSAQPVKDEYTNDSLSEAQSTLNEFFSSLYNLAIKTTNSPQSASTAERMEEKCNFGELLQFGEFWNTTKSSQLETNINLVQEGSTANNFDNDISSNVQKCSPALSSVNGNLNNIQKASNKSNIGQSLTSKQNETSNSTSSMMINKNDHNTAPLDNSPIKGMKRKAADFFYLNDNVNNLGNNLTSNPQSALIEQKKKKKNQKVVQPPISKKLKKTKQNKNNFLITKNSKSLMCAIVEEQYPNMPPLTNVHLGIVRNVINEKIDNIPYGVFIPRFINAFINNGVIMVECADNNSKEWLIHAITNYNPEKGIYLKVLPPESLNQYYPASIFVHDEENAINVLRRMQKQNSDISIRNWQYLSMITVKDGTPGITIDVGIPATSVAQLKEKNFRLFHAMDQVSVIMKVPLPF